MVQSLWRLSGGSISTVCIGAVGSSSIRDADWLCAIVHIVRLIIGDAGLVLSC